MGPPNPPIRVRIVIPCHPPIRGYPFGLGIRGEGVSIDTPRKG